MKKNWNYNLLFGLALLLFSCKTPPIFQYRHSEYTRCVSTYIGNPRHPANLHKRLYYDNIGNLRELILYGGDVRVVKYYFDSNQVQLQEYRCFRNCDNGLRTLSKFDSLGRLLGYYRTTLPSIDIDTCKIEQVYFYDNENRVIKEKT